MAQYIDKSALVAEIKHHLQFIPEHTNGFIEGEEYAYRTILSFLDTLEVKEVSAWKDARCEDLPEIDREVIALIQDEDDAWITKVVFAHRPPKYWDGKNILTGEVTRYTPKTYDKGGWNIPNVEWWLDLELPKIEE